MLEHYRIRLLVCTKNDAGYAGWPFWHTFPIIPYLIPLLGFPPCAALPVLLPAFPLPAVYAHRCQAGDGTWHSPQPTALADVGSASLGSAVTHLVSLSTLVHLMGGLLAAGIAACGGAACADEWPALHW